MAARAMLKLITKTCSYTITSSSPCKISSFNSEKSAKRTQRSCSQPREHYRPNRENFLQVRKISKSLQNLREIRYHEEEYQESEDEGLRTTYLNTFPLAKDLRVRETAKEFKEKPPVEEKTEEGNPIYELAEATKSEDNYYDVLNFMKRIEQNKQKKLFPHLQPSNLKPYGSNENVVQTHGHRKRRKIVYPPGTQRVTLSRSEGKTKRMEEVPHKEYSSYTPQKEYPGYEETPKLAKSDSKKAPLHKKNYSTSCIKPKMGRSKVSVTSTRKSSSVLLKKNEKRSEEILEKTTLIDQFYKKISEYKAKRKNRDFLIVDGPKSLYQRRAQSTSQNKSMTHPPHICDDYVTVKLRDLQEECRREKKCKPKKISFGRLPKIVPPDCACLEDIPLKEGKPLLRLKKRFDIPDRDNSCPEQETCTTPRADANYKIVPKTLPQITVKDCPCEEREMTDLVIKRLPKKVIPEPPKVCITCVGEECCPPRADGKIIVEKKALPKLKINDCPCIEDIPLKDVPLKKLKPALVKEPEKICVVEEKCVIERADANLKVTKKVLPALKGDCPCPEPPEIEEGKPIKRLRKVKIPEKPRPTCEVEVCDEQIRADKKIKIVKKKLPVFVPRNCPCVEEEPPSLMVKLKRLQPKSIPKEKEKICLTEECGSRADDGLVIKPKQLPVLEPKECPCVEVEMLDAPPLKKLIPKPVKEPPKICIQEAVCITPRADEALKVGKKSLPTLPPGNCPCIEAPAPLDVKPLKKLKKKPVTYKRICPEEEPPCPERADEHLKVKVKKLPVLEIPDCPCIEPPPPVDVKPLKRLRKVEIKEPPKICPKIDDCDDIPRSDEDDWLYWKRVEVKPPECDPPKKNSKRNYSTIARRYYSTSVDPQNDIFKVKYDVPRLPMTTLNDKAYDIIIDIKPSAPLILTQKPLPVTQKDPLDDTSPRNVPKRSDSIDYVSFVIYRSKTLGGKSVSNRFISTCSTLYEYSERPKDKLKDHVTPSCECPPNDQYLQPRNPIITEKESFIQPYPNDELIEDSARKSRLYCRTRKDSPKHVAEDPASCPPEEVVGAEATAEEAICEAAEEKKLSLWERIVNYFKARPDCPSPEEFKKMRLKEDAQKAAEKAGLCLYDPKEMLKKNEKEMPKVITADSIREGESRK